MFIGGGIEAVVSPQAPQGLVSAIVVMTYLVGLQGPLPAALSPAVRPPEGTCPLARELAGPLLGGLLLPKVLKNIINHLFLA
jgi:hypothetical protein